MSPGEKDVILSELLVIKGDVAATKTGVDTLTGAVKDVQHKIEKTVTTDDCTVRREKYYASVETLKHDITQIKSGIDHLKRGTGNHPSVASLTAPVTDQSGSFEVPKSSFWVWAKDRISVILGIIALLGVLGGVFVWTANFYIKVQKMLAEQKIQVVDQQRVYLKKELGKAVIEIRKDIAKPRMTSDDRYGVPEPNREPKSEPKRKNRRRRSP